MSRIKLSSYLKMFNILEVTSTVHGRSKKEEYKSYIIQSNFSNLLQTPVFLETINRGDYEKAGTTSK